ncbi:hypothetical protein CYMTET_10332 [Cymbomonas tetramitiformis]|uniref:Serine/threonine-protein phosphatase 4 regulatory subunit 3-like central domain-containing protein n=1 Tax=Cymbomonas tetramitiformis TaxID=36881 RepID=A0AAE0LEK2_9CHLO|nr:hypothetical protein CYMTET_10332 [Cymbomonas tetramitiformis]
MTSGAPREEELDYSYMQRVKVYRLNENGQWDDKGTGHVSVEYMEQSDAAGLVVISEEDTSTLLIHRISREEIYQRQGADTIISWLDPEIGTDIALSFQEAVGCNYIWEQIQGVQSQSSRKGSSLRRVDEFDMSESKGEDECFQDSERNRAVDLPAPEMGNLPEIVKMLEVTSPFARDKVASCLMKKGYIRKLLDLFRTCEDLEDAEGLIMTYKIVRGMIMLNVGDIFDTLFQEDHVMDMVGALEYDPELPSKQNHRSWLRDVVVFKEVVPITDPAIVAKIHQTYRIGYLKDVILARVLDDGSFQTLSSLMLFNNVEVVLALQNDPSFFKELFNRLRSLEPSQTDWRDLIAFIQELCVLAKHFQAVHRAQLFTALIRNGLFNVLTVAVHAPDSATRLRCSDILLAGLQHDPSTLRNFLNHQPNHELFTSLVEGLLKPDEDGVQEQFLEILRMLLDPESMDQSVDKNMFLEVFYEEYIDQLVGALAQCLVPKQAPDGKQSTPTSATTLGLIIELLCYCVKHHSYRIKYYVLRNNVVEKVLKLTQRSEKFLVIAAVRFLRTCIGLKDEFYHRYLTKNNLFEPVITAFLTNGNRYNLLNSCVLELVEFIRRENIKSLIGHLVENFGDKFEKVDYVETFYQLKIRYEQQQDRSAAVGSTAGEVGPGSNRIGVTAGPAAGPGPLGVDMQVRRRGRDARSVDKDEEDYFSTEDDDDDDQGRGSGSRLGCLSGLVDYGEEEEEVTGTRRANSLLEERPIGPMPPGGGKRPLNWTEEGSGSSDHGKRVRREEERGFGQDAARGMPIGQ